MVRFCYLRLSFGIDSFHSSVEMDCKDSKWIKTYTNNKIQNIYSNSNQIST